MATRRPGISAKAIGYALIVHIFAGLLLFTSFRWYVTTKPAAEKKEPVKAVVVDDARVRAEMEKLKREEQQRKNEEIAREQRAEEAKHQAQEAEKKRQAEEKRLAELKQKQEEERKKNAELEKKRQEDEKRRAEAVEKKRLAEEEQKRALERKRKEAEQALREQMQAEEKQRDEVRAANAAAKAAAEAERYKALIQQKVERNWVRPVVTVQNPSCVVRVRLVPGGEVLEARVIRSSGNPAFDRSVESAVLKASPLPLPTDKQMFEYFRELEFTFKPKA